MTEGYVAFIDILGFGRQIASSEEVDDIFEDYTEAIDDCCTSLAGDEASKPTYAIFSDSIVLYNEADTRQGFTDMCFTASRLFYELVHLGLPPRGCITRGNFRQEDQEGGTLVYGSPVVEAVDYESRQDWVGIILGPSVNEYWAENGDHDWQTGRVVEDVMQNHTEASQPWRLLLAEHSVPFKAPDASRDDYTWLTYASVPLADGAFDRPGFTQSVNDARRELLRLRSYAPDPSDQAKYNRTADFLRDCSNSASRLS